MTDNLPRQRAKSVYFSAIAAILAPAAVSFGAYGSANTYDLNGSLANSKANAIVGSRQLGQGFQSPNTNAEIWLGNSAALSNINSGYYHAFILGGSFTQYVGGGDLLAGSSDQALLWTVNADGTINAPINLNPAGNSLSYANATFGNQQVGFAKSTTTFLQHAYIWSGSAASGVDVHSLLPAAITGVAQSQSYILSTNGTQQVGYAHIPLNGQNYIQRAILWNGTGSAAVDLSPTSSGYQATYARAIVGNQQFGAAWYDGSDGHAKDTVHAQMWTGTSASMTDINPASYVNSNVFAAASTISGLTLVGSGNTSGSAEHAIYWNGTTFAADLHTLLPGAPTNSRALAIDVYGNISGYATYSGQPHAVTWLAGNTYKIANGSGAWSTNANWLSGAAPAAGQDVFLLCSDATGATVTYASASPLSLNRLVIDAVATGPLAVSQSQDSLTVANEFLGYVGKGAYSQSAGTHNVTGTLKLGANAGAQGQYNLSGTGALTVTNLSINSASTFNQTGGTLNATATLNAGTLNLAGTSNVGALDAVASGSTSAALSAAGTTSIAANTIATATRLRQNSLSLFGTALTNSGKLTILESAPGLGTGLPAGNDSMVSIVKSIAIDNDGLGNFFSTLDLANNDLIIDYTGGASPLNQIEAMVKSGYNSGTWTGPGITSSTAAAAPGLYHLAVADNALLGGVALNSFDGVDTSNHQQVIVKFTWVADINLDGLVNANDAIAFATAYNEGLTGAHHQFGDLNYDGTINSNDAILFATAYNEALQHLPEPSSLALLTLGALALVRRRRS